MKQFDSRGKTQAAAQAVSGKLPLKYIVITALLCFSLIMIVLLWLFQTVFLDGFYKSIKTTQIKSCAASIVYNIKKDNVDQLADLIAQQNDMTICIYDTTNNVYVSVYTSYKTGEYGKKNIKDHEIYEYYRKAKQNGGVVLETVEGWDRRQEQQKPPNGFSLNGEPLPLEKEGAQSLIYGKIVPDSDGSEYFIFLDSLVTPLNTTVEVLRVQLVVITWILVALSIILAVVLSRVIANPIIRMNKSAKELAKQNYSVRFEGGHYTEIAELNETLNYATAELSKVENLRRELIANVSHDLLTPLTMIIGYSEVIRDIPGESTPENLQIIIDEATRLSVLVSDMLDISKLQSGTIKLEKSEFSLSETIYAIFTRYSKLIEQQGYNILYEHNGDVIINADQIKITQVIYNLINNAINYAGEDKTVIVRQTVSEDGRVKIEVEDHGQGIEPDKIDYIWDRYYKVDKSHKSSVIGTGLGLSIVKNVLNLHGADYGVRSVLGEGSVFWFSMEYASYKPAAGHMLAESSRKNTEISVDRIKKQDG